MKMRHITIWWRVQILTQRSRHKFFTVSPPNANKHNLIASYLHVREIYGFCDLRVDLRIRLATLRMSPYASSGFANLRRLESPFGQGFIVNARIEIQAKYNATTMVKSTACLTKRTYDSDMHLRWNFWRLPVVLTLLL